jgi:CHAD domain-containing protein
VAGDGGGTRSGAKSRDAELLRRMLDEQVAAVRAADSELRPHPDAGIHRMRLALRRLRSTLTTFRPVLSEPAAELRTELGWIAGELGPLRDADVLLARLTGPSPTEPRLASEARAVVTPFLRDLRREGLDRGQAAWGSERYADLTSDLTRLLGSGVVRGDEQRLADLVVAELDRLRRAARDLDGNDKDQLHELRRVSRRARHASVVLLERSGKPAAKLERDLDRLQLLLGDRHDAAVARHQLHAMLADRRLDGPGVVMVGRLLSRVEAATAVLDERLPKAVRKATRHRDWLEPAG